MPVLTKITPFCPYLSVCLQSAEQLVWLLLWVCNFLWGQRNSRTQLPAWCLFASFGFFFCFFNLCYNCIFWEGNHQHQLLLSQDAFRCVTSDKQAIISSLLLDHQAEGSSLTWEHTHTSGCTGAPMSELWLSVLTPHHETCCPDSAKLEQSGLGYPWGTHCSDLTVFTLLSLHFPVLNSSCKAAQLKFYFLNCPL